MGPAELIALLLERGRTVATAESCTGGLLGKLLTDIPGSSGAYLGGVISYTCPAGERLLGVDQVRVGLVYVALAGERWTLCDELCLTGGRKEIREQACAHALQMLWDSLTNE